MASENTPSKKEKKEKKDKAAKKRAREDDAGVEPEERKHKKSKSVVTGSIPSDVLDAAANGDLKEEKKKKKKDKKKSEQAEELAGKAEGTEPEKKEKKRKSKKNAEATTEEPTAEPVTEEATQKKKKKKSKKEESAADHQSESAPLSDPDAMDVDDTSADTKPAVTTSSSGSKIHSPSDIPSNPQFPFFNQTVSLYEPLYPNGWAHPISGCESQHLRHLQNRYVPSLRGVLLEYSKVSLNDKPGREGAALDDESSAFLRSRAEFAGGFGWITADVRLFVPSRGAWMEGSINLQTEGHIGVVCFGKFNASIEARRLPPSWKWIPNEDAEDGFEETASVFTAADEHGVVRQIHSTGYWVDGDGAKVKGKTRFRIRNFDVGVSGESTYLSLQGTMLNKAGEKKLVEQEAREARERKERKGGHARKKAPEFSMTRFLGDEEQQPEEVPEVSNAEVQITEEDLES